MLWWPCSATQVRPFTRGGTERHNPRTEAKWRLLASSDEAELTNNSGDEENDDDDDSADVDGPYHDAIDAEAGLDDLSSLSASSSDSDDITADIKDMVRQALLVEGDQTARAINAADPAVMRELTRVCD